MSASLKHVPADHPDLRGSLYDKVLLSLVRNKDSELVGWRSAHEVEGTCLVGPPPMAISPGQP